MDMDIDMMKPMPGMYQTWLHWSIETIYFCSYNHWETKLNSFIVFAKKNKNTEKRGEILNQSIADYKLCIYNP